MINYFIYAKDFSGSTSGNRYFHSNGMKSYQQFKTDVEKIEKELVASGEPLTDSKIIYLHWGDKCYEVDEDTTKETYKQLEGCMGTEPATIIEWIQQNDELCDKKNKIKLLYIITDGLIDRHSAEHCFKLNENMDYETVVFHAFNEYLEGIDMSVAASFFKNRCMAYRNYELFDNVDISEEFDYSKIDLENFEAETENLKSYIKIKYIGKVTQDNRALSEIDKLKKLRARIFAELLSKPTKTESNLDTKNRVEFLRKFKNTDWYKNLSDPSQDRKIDIEKVFTTLINYITNEKKSYSFDGLKFVKTFDKPIEVEPIVDVNFTTAQEIEFPDIILDDDKGIPVIILTECNLLDSIIFHKTEEIAEVSPASFNKFRSVMECPLFLMKDEGVKTSIGYFYTLNVYKRLLENSTRTEPRTRRPFHGGLVLTDTDQFDKYNDYILAATYFNSKKVNYNIGLFYYVLWKNCENKEWMDKNVVEQFKKYTMRRISETRCNIGLSSLPLDPRENTSLLTALWYCVELSSYIFKDDPKYFNYERLRMHYGIAHFMIEILQYFNYDLNLKAIERRKDLIKNVMILKKIQIQEEKVYFLLKNVFKTEKGFLVNEFVNRSNINKLNYLKLNHKEMLSENILNEKVDVNDYIHLIYFIGESGKSKAGSFEICKKTFRPYFIIDENKSFYTELLMMAKKVAISKDEKRDKIKITCEPIYSLEFERILSLYNLYINCVKRFKKYPTLEEYIEYILNKKKFQNHLVTIFSSNTYYDAKEVYERYQEIVSEVDFNTFIEVTKKYVTRSDRIKAEERMHSKTDLEIDTFIADEELMCGLVRKKITRRPKPKKVEPVMPPVMPSFIEVTKKYVTQYDRIKAEERMHSKTDLGIDTFIADEEFMCGLVRKKITRRPKPKKVEPVMLSKRQIKRRRRRY